MMEVNFDVVTTKKILKTAAYKRCHGCIEHIICILCIIYIYWMWPPRSTSDYQEGYIFAKGSYKPEFATVTGMGPHPICIYIYTVDYTNVSPTQNGVKHDHKPQPRREPEPQPQPTPEPEPEPQQQPQPRPQPRSRP